MTRGLKTFFRKEPEKIIEWHDSESPARGWLVFNSLRGGAAGGGTRMKPGCTKKEVIDLAKTMEIKFAISGPAIGGAKSGIDYRFRDEEDKRSVLRRWYKHIENELKQCYGTGGDQNVDFTTDVVPLLQELGIQHPQEGIVRGHYAHLSKEIQDKIIFQLQKGVLEKIEDPYLRSMNCTIADVATGFGVVEVIKAFLALKGDTLQGKRVIVEGLGNVGGAAAYYAHAQGARVVGILEYSWYSIDAGGLSVPAIYKDFREQTFDLHMYPEAHLYSAEGVTLPHADIFIPAATSATIDMRRLKKLADAGVTIIAPGANNPFVKERILRIADKQFSVLADFVTNAGMARTFSYLMRPNVVVDASSILNDISTCMSDVVSEIVEREKSSFGLLTVAEEMVIARLSRIDE